MPENTYACPNGGHTGSNLQICGSTVVICSGYGCDGTSYLLSECCADTPVASSATPAEPVAQPDSVQRRAAVPAFAG